MDHGQKKPGRRARSWVKHGRDRAHRPNSGGREMRDTALSDTGDEPRATMAQ